MRVMQHEEGRSVLVAARGGNIGGATSDGYKVGIERQERELGLRY